MSTPSNMAFQRTRRLASLARVGSALSIAVAVTLGSTVIKIWPSNYFWVERGNARMPVWVRGDTSSGTFIILNHGGPGSCGTAESIFEVNPGNGRPDHPSPLQALESGFAMVYWDQRCSGMSGGGADPNASTLDDFGLDLAAVIANVKARYEVQHLFLIGQSWGHVVALSYMTVIRGWQANQAQIDGYIGYKSNHEANAPYSISRPAIIRVARQRIAAGQDVPYWQRVLRLHQQRLTLTSPGDFALHSDAAFRAQGGAVSVAARVWASVTASIFSPFNGWLFYLNNKRLNSAQTFWAWVTTDTTLSRTTSRVAVPVLLIYGGRDLVAPPEVGQGILGQIQTPQAQKRLLILPNSRHGAEGQDIPVMLSAIRAFVAQTIANERLAASACPSLPESDPPSGMALQRTRALAYAQVRPPLNALPAQ